MEMDRCIIMEKATKRLKYSQNIAHKIHTNSLKECTKHKPEEFSQCPWFVNMINIIYYVI